MFFYFLAYYFYEIEHELTNDPTGQYLAKLGNRKEEVMVYFMLKQKVVTKTIVGSSRGASIRFNHELPKL